MASNISSNMEIPQNIDDRPQEIYLDKHVRLPVCAACDFNPQAWKDLGKVLMPDAVAELSIISQDHRDSVLNCCSRMFELWLQRQPDASWKQLIEALRKINLITLATQIEGMLKPSVDQAAAGASVVPVIPVESGLDLSGDTCVKRHVGKNTLGYLREKYITLTTNLKKVFKEKEDHYSVADILTGLCNADEDNLTCFANLEFFRSVKTMDEVFHSIGIACKYFDYELLKAYVYGSQCAEAITLMDNYVKEVDSTVITGLNLQSEYHSVQTEFSNGGIKKFEIFYSKNELNIKKLNVIREAIQRCFRLPMASIIVTDIVKHCTIIVCCIPLKVQDHLLQLRLTAHQLKPLSALHITAFIVDGSMKLSIPIDCDTEDVISWTPCIQTLRDVHQGMIPEKGVELMSQAQQHEEVVSMEVDEDTGLQKMYPDELLQDLLRENVIPETAVAHYFELGIQLDLSVDDIRAIEKEMDQEDIVESTREILVKWLQSPNGGVSGELISAIRQCDLIAYAESLEEELGPEKKLTEKDLRNIIPHIATHWADVGIYLGVKNLEKFGSYEKKFKKILELWLRRNSKPVNELFDMFYEGLQSIALSLTAERFRINADKFMVKHQLKQLQ